MILPASYVAEPFLTVAAQPAYELGAAAARLMLKRIQGDGDGADNRVDPAHADDAAGIDAGAGWGRRENGY
jgi:DNA-binding LacI/PurR family transcriptional regulator